MSGDLFSGLGGLVKGLSGLMPQNDPGVQMMSAQSEAEDLRRQEEKLCAEIGRQALEKYGADAFGELGDRLALVRKDIAGAKAKLDEITARLEAQAQAEKACTCPEYGTLNPEGTKFCNECGTKLIGTDKTFCKKL